MKRFLVFLCLICALSGLSWAGNFGSSIEGKDANVSFIHTSAIDSAHIVFAYPDTSNWYDSVFTYPVAWGSSKILNGAGLNLDSIGVHIVKVRYYSGESVAGHIAGVWLHETDSVYAACDDAGSNTVIIWIKSTADSSGVAGFSIDVEDSISGASTPYGASTNSAGVCTLGLDNGSYVLYLSAPRWSIASPVYRTISANVTLTYYATAMAPSSPPPGDSVCIVYGYVLHEDNTPYANARVRIWMSTTGVTYHGSLVDVGGPAVAYTDTAGYFEFSSTKSNVEGILPNALLEPENTLWWIEVATKERERIYARYHIVPVAASWELVVTH